MTKKVEGPRTVVLTGYTSPEAIFRLVDRSLKPGTSMSLGVSGGRVNVTLDGSGDWTIMVGLPSRSQRITTTAHSLEKLGFFRAAENDGIIYLLWTSALEDMVNERSLVEGTLFETLSALQRTAPINYIC